MPDKFLPGEPSPGARGARPEHHQQPHHDGYQAHPPQEPHHDGHLATWHRPNMQPALAPGTDSPKHVFFSAWQRKKKSLDFQGARKRDGDRGLYRWRGDWENLGKGGELGQRTMLCVPLNYFYDITLQFWKFNLLAKFCMSCCDYDLSFDAFDLKLR